MSDDGQHCADHYARALERALASATREAEHLRATRQDLLVGSPEAIEAAGHEAARRSGRLTRRSAILEQRARELADLLGAEGPSFSQLAAHLPDDARARLSEQVEELTQAGLDLQRERHRFREALVIGRTVVRTLLDGLTRGDATAVDRRTTRGLRRPVTCGALNREA